MMVPVISCKNLSYQAYPPELEHAIDLFFLENKTDDVLNCLESDILRSQPENILQVIQIFKAAALSESNRADSAAIIIQQVNTDKLEKRDQYYYNSIQALTLFRLNKYPQSFEIIAGLLALEPFDIRCLALNERITARILSYYESYEDAIRLLLFSSKRYREKGLEKSVSVNSKFLANIYTHLGSFEEAMLEINEAEKTFVAYKDHEELYYLYLVAINTTIQMKELDKAQRYAKLAMETDNFMSDNQKKASIYNYLGSIANLNGDHHRAIAMFRNVLEIDDDYFGSERRKVTACISLASIYNSLNNREKAKEYASYAIKIIGDNEYNHSKFEAYRQLSDSFTTRDPLSSFIYLDSAQYYLEKHHQLSTASMVDFVKTDYQLNEATRKIDQIMEATKRQKISLLFGIITLIFLTVIYLIVSVFKKRINHTSMELVRKNITQLNREKKISEVINQHKELIRNEAISPYLSNDQKATLLYLDFKKWLKENKAYLDPDLNLNYAAREMATNRSYLSAAINQQGMKFTELINKYRIEEVIRIFEDSLDPRFHKNLDEIALEVGFQAKSTFYDSFRKETGMTPSQFREYIRFEKRPDYKSLAN